MDWIVRNAPVLLLGAALAVAAAMTLVLTADNTYFGDSWALLIERRDLSVDTVLHPHNEHLIAIPAMLEMASIRLFGMDSARPGQIVLVLILLATAVLLFVYVRRRVGPWLALFAAVLVLFLGPAWEVLLWPFEITFCGPVLFGLAMLLALEREDTPGDVAACVFLLISLGFSSLGVPFIAAAAVAVLLGPRDRWLRRSYVFVVPGLLFAAWYAGWGQDAESTIALRNALGAPRSVLDSLATAVASVLGLGPIPPGGVPDLSWGRAIVVGLVIVFGYRLLRRPGLPLGIWPVTAAAAATWFLTALPGRDPTASRYQYAGAILVLMIASNLLDGVRPGRRAILAGAVITALAVAPNLVDLRDGANVFKRQGFLARADTAAVEIARPTVAPDFQLAPEIAGTPSLINVYAGEYFEAIDEYGSPAYSVSELRSAPEEGRAQADVVLAAALPVEARIARGGVPTGAGCLVVNDDEEATDVRLAPGSAWVSLGRGPAGEIRMRRFAEDGYPVALGPLPAGSVTRIAIPVDAAPGVRWRLLVESDQPGRVCQR
jgi:hypothetical protein